MSPLPSVKMTSASKRCELSVAKVTLLHSMVNWRFGAVPVVEVRIAELASTLRSSSNTSTEPGGHWDRSWKPIQPFVVTHTVLYVWPYSFSGNGGTRLASFSSPVRAETVDAGGEGRGAVG